MLVLHSRANRLTRMHAPLERNMFDDEVLYLGTVNRRRALDEASALAIQPSKTMLEDDPQTKEQRFEQALPVTGPIPA